MSNVHDLGAPDGPMTPEQQAVARSLSQDAIDKIDAALLSHAKRSPRKIAMIVGLTMMDPTMRVPGLIDLFYAERVRSLVAKGTLVARGDLGCMGRCEVWLP